MSVHQPHHQRPPSENSLSWCKFPRKGRREGEHERDVWPLLFASRGPSRFATSRSLSFRARLCSRSNWKKRCLRRMQSLMQISPNRKNTDTFFTLPLPSLLHTHDSLGLGFAQEVHYITTVYLRFIEIYYGCQRIFKGRHRPASRPNKFSDLTKKKRTQTSISQRLARHQRSKM